MLHGLGAFYLRFVRWAIPYPAFGMRSTSVVLGRWRASETGINCPVPESRPRRVALLVLLAKFLTSFAGTPHKLPATRYCVGPNKD